MRRPLRRRRRDPSDYPRTHELFGVPALWDDGPRASGVILDADLAESIGDALLEEEEPGGDEPVLDSPG